VRQPAERRRPPRRGRPGSEVPRNPPRFPGRRSPPRDDPARQRADLTSPREVVHLRRQPRTHDAPSELRVNTVGAAGDIGTPRAMVKTGFDIDGCLITLDDQPGRDVIDTLIFLSSECHCEITVWSGGGKDWAAIWVRRLFLDRYVTHIQEKPIHRAKAGEGTF